MTLLTGVALSMALAGCGRTLPGGGGAPPSPRAPTAAVAAATQRPPTPDIPNGIAFAELDSARTGIRFRWPEQPRPMRNKEAFGRGCAFLDYDNDGRLDVLLVGSPRVALYRNRGDLRFEEVTDATGLSGTPGDWIGCAVGDVDGDGFPDLLLTGYRRLALLRNERGRRFAEVTKAAGLAPDNRGHWGSSAGFMDLDNNGTLDLVLLNYVVFGPREKQYCELSPGLRSGCPPREYRPEFGEVWKNHGDSTFADVSATAGMKTTSGKALVVAFADVDADGRVDFYIGNDGTPAELMHNQGGMRFRNVGAESGTAYGPQGDAIAAMGADWGDYDRDGHPDLTVTAFSDEPYSLLHNLGEGVFEEAAAATGIAAATLHPLGFGAKWIDVDNDGWLDIVFANGHVYDNVDRINPSSTFRQPLQLFHNRQGGGSGGGGRRFVDIAPALGGPFVRPIVGRGSAIGDIDNDGRPDLLVVDYEGPPLLLHNRSKNENHWITLDLRGAAPNRFAYGARVVARAGNHTWTGQVSPASSYLSSSDPRVHLGLGTVTRLDTITIFWPSGPRQVLNNVPVDRILRVNEPAGAARGS